MKTFGILLALAACVSAKNATVVRLSGAGDAVIGDHTAPLGLRWKAYKAKFDKMNSAATPKL